MVNILFTKRNVFAPPKIVLLLEIGLSSPTPQEVQTDNFTQTTSGRYSNSVNALNLINEGSNSACYREVKMLPTKRVDLRCEAHPPIYMPESENCGLPCAILSRPFTRI